MLKEGSFTDFFMDLHSANAFIRVIAENHSRYSVATQLALLEGIFQLADDCQEKLSERADAQQYESLQISLGLIKLFVDEALKSGDLPEGFRSAYESFRPGAVVPPEFE
jgi:hypothetical protein